MGLSFILETHNVGVLTRRNNKSRFDGVVRVRLHCDRSNYTRRVQVCVDKCPVENFAAELYLVNQPLDTVVRDKLICKYHVDKNIILTTRDMQDRVRSNECASWYLESQHSKLRLIPVSNYSTETFDT